MTAYNDEILADSPLIYVPMDGSTSTNLGSRAISVTASAGTSFVGGKQGQSVLMAGPSVPSYINYNVGTHNYFNDGTWAVELWFKKTTAGDTGYMELLNTYDGTSANSFTIYGSDGTGKLAAWYRFNGGTQYKITGPVINDTLWHHVVVSSDGTNVRLYLDAVEVGTAGVTTNAAFPSGTNMWMGAYGTSAGSENWNGRIDEWAIYPAALSTTRISAHYAQGFNYGVATASASLPMPTVSATDGRTPIGANPDVDILWSNNNGIDTIFLFNGIGNYTLIKMDDMNFGDNPSLVSAQLVLKLTMWSTTSWTITPITQSWTPSGAPNPTVDAAKAITIPSANVTVLGNDFYSVDITSIANYWVNGTLANYGVKITGVGNAARNQSPSSARTSYIQYSYRTDGISVNYSAPPMTESGSFVMPSITAGIGNSQSVDAMTASSSMEMPGVSVNTVISSEAMSASASLVEPSLVIPDRNIDVSAMTASATMPGGYFQVNVANSIDVATASASMPNVSVSGELNARTTANVMTASATIIPPAEAQGNDADPYYLRLNSQVTETSALWYRMDEVSGTVAHNERGNGNYNGTYVGGPTFGVSGLEGRKAVHFDGVNDGIVFPDNDLLTARGTYEFVFRTTKATQTIVQGIDFNFNNFGGHLRGTMIGLSNGKIDVFPSSKGQYTGTTTLNDGQWHHVVVTFFRFENTLGHAGQLAVYVDGKVEFKRFLNEQQVFVAIPDGLGGIGSRAEGWPVTQGERAATIPFEGDIMEFVFRPDAVLFETDAIRNYYYAFGYNPIYPEAMTASATMPDAIGKGNQKRALALFSRADVDENLDVPNYWDKYNWTGIRTSSRYPAVGVFLRPNGLPASFDLGGFKVFPRSIHRNETASVDNDYLGGAYYDKVTGEPRYISLIEDIDVSGYDLVFFLSLPPTQANQYGGVEATPKNWENMVNDLRAAQDKYGFSIWAPQPELAAQLGVIDKWEVHSMLRETSFSNAQGNASGLYDARGPQINPWNTGSGETADPKFYYDTHAANKYRIVSLVDDLTTLGGYIVEDYFYGRPRDPFKIPFEGWKYKDVSGGLQIGDEMYYPQDFWAASNSSSWFITHNKRRSVVAVPPQNVKAGTVVTRENDTHYVNTSEVANPYADYATSIIVKPGDTLKGRQANGKIYVNFMEGADGNFGALRKQIVPPNDQIPNPHSREDAAKRAWDYASYRVSATAQTITGPGPTGGAGQTPIGENSEIESPTPGGGALVSVNETEKYQVVFLEQISMLGRAFNWMAIRDETGPGDKIVRPDVLQANAAMPMPVVNAEKSTGVYAEAMLAGASMVPNTEVQDKDVSIRAFPMTALGFMPGVGRTINVEPMTAIGTMPFTFDMVHGGGEQIVLYLHYNDAIVFVKEDA